MTATELVMWISGFSLPLFWLKNNSKKADLLLWCSGVLSFILFWVMVFIKNEYSSFLTDTNKMILMGESTRNVILLFVLVAFSLLFTPRPTKKIAIMGWGMQFVLIVLMLATMVKGQWLIWPILFFFMQMITGWFLLNWTSMNLRQILNWFWSQVLAGLLISIAIIWTFILHSKTIFPLISYVLGCFLALGLPPFHSPFTVIFKKCSSFFLFLYSLFLRPILCFILWWWGSLFCQQLGVNLSPADSLMLGTILIGTFLWCWIAALIASSWKDVTYYGQTSAIAVFVLSSLFVNNAPSQGMIVLLFAYSLGVSLILLSLVFFFSRENSSICWWKIIFKTVLKQKKFILVLFFLLWMLPLMITFLYSFYASSLRSMIPLSLIGGIMILGWIFKGLLLSRALEFLYIVKNEDGL